MWTKHFFANLKRASETRVSRASASCRFQATFRMWQVRRAFLRVLASITLVQRLFRGFLGRRKTLARRISLAQEEQRKLFGFWATAIQRHFRGYYSRRHTHDARARRKFLAAVEIRGERTVAALREFEKETSEQRAISDQQGDYDKLKLVSSQLHHLLSTKNIPGVYNPPFPINPPSLAQGITVETFIKSAVRDVLSLKPRFPPRASETIKETSETRNSLLSVTANIGRQRSPQGPFGDAREISDRFQSLQASTPFDREHRVLALEKSGERKTRLGGEFGFPKKKDRSFLGSVAANSIFQEQTTESLFRSDYAVLSRLKHFRTHLPRNRFLHE